MDIDSAVLQEGGFWVKGLQQRRNMSVFETGAEKAVRFFCSLFRSVSNGTF